MKHPRDWGDWVVSLEEQEVFQGRGETESSIDLSSGTWIKGDDEWLGLKRGYSRSEQAGQQGDGGRETRQDIFSMGLHRGPRFLMKES